MKKKLGIDEAKTIVTFFIQIHHLKKKKDRKFSVHS